MGTLLPSLASSANSPLSEVQAPLTALEPGDSPLLRHGPQFPSARWLPFTCQGSSKQPPQTQYSALWLNPSSTAFRSDFHGAWVWNTHYLL